MYRARRRHGIRKEVTTLLDISAHGCCQHPVGLRQTTRGAGVAKGGGQGAGVGVRKMWHTMLQSFMTRKVEQITVERSSAVKSCLGSCCSHAAHRIHKKLQNSIELDQHLHMLACSSMGSLAGDDALTTPVCS